MSRVFYRRMAVEFQKVAVMAVACMRHENSETVVKQLQKLRELMFPGDGKAEEKTKEEMKQILKSEGAKSYRVRRVYLGEKRASR